MYHIQYSTCIPFKLISFEGLQKRPEEVDRRAANMYSFALILWEIGTNNVPFGGMSPMCAGLMVRV